MTARVEPYDVGWPGVIAKRVTSPAFGGYVTQRRGPYSKEQQQEDMGRADTRGLFTRYGWTINDLSRDLGQDVEVCILDNGHPTGLTFHVQHKSTDDSGCYALQNGDLSYPIKVDHLLRWCDSVPPVYIVLWDTDQRAGWWLSIQDAILDLDASTSDWRSRKTVNVRIPHTNRLDDDGLSRIRAKVAAYLFPSISQGKTVEFKVEFTFPDTAEGLAARASLQRHIDFGDQVQLPGQYIKALQLSQWFERVWGKFDPGRGDLVIGPRASKRSIPARLDVLTPSGHAATVPFIDLRVLKKGQKQATLANTGQSIPLEFEFVAPQSGPTFDMSVRVVKIPTEVGQLRELMLLRNALAEGGRLRLTLLNDNKVIETQLPPGMVDAAPHEVETVMEELWLIEQKTGARFILGPGFSLSDWDVATVHMLARVLKCGICGSRNATAVFRVRRETADTILAAHLRGESLVIVERNPEPKIHLLGTTISLGPVTYTYTGRLGVPQQDLEKQLLALRPDELVEVRLIGGTVTEEFAKWQPVHTAPTGRDEVPPEGLLLFGDADTPGE